MAFREGFVEADGFRIRYLSAGEGPVLVHLHGSGGLRLTRAHALLSERHRVVAFEMPGFGSSPENTRTDSTMAMAGTMADAIRALGVQACDLLGTSFGAKVGLWLAAQEPSLVRALVLESPAAIRPAGMVPPSGAPEQAQGRALVMRLRGPDRDAALEAAMRSLAVPTLVLFGTRDPLFPPELGRHYKALLPNCHLLFVYDAGHAIGDERPEAFVEAVADFVERREAFVINRAATVINP